MAWRLMPAWPEARGAAGWAPLAAAAGHINAGGQPPPSTALPRAEAAMKARAAEQLSSATAAMVTQGNLEAEAEAARRREEAARAKAEAEAEAEAARLAAEAEEKLRLEAEAAAAADPVLALRRLVAAGKPPKELAAALKEADVKGELGRMCRAARGGRRGAREPARSRRCRPSAAPPEGFPAPCSPAPASTRARLSRRPCRAHAPAVRGAAGRRGRGREAGVAAGEAGQVGVGPVPP